jgi:hypothetical protein
VGRQQHAERRAQAGLGVDVDGAAGPGHDAVHGGQAEPGAAPLRLGREERLEQPVQGGPVHAHAGVGHPEPDVAAGRQGRPPGGVGLVDLDVAGVDGQPAAARHRVARVHGQVDQYLLELAPVGLDRPQRRLRADGQLDVLDQRAVQQLARALHGPVEVEHLGPGHLVPGEREQLPGQPGRLLGRHPDLLDVVQHGGQLGVGLGQRLDLLGGEVGVALDHVEQVVEVVRDPAHQLAQALQPLGLLGPALGPLPFRVALDPPVTGGPRVES